MIPSPFGTRCWASACRLWSLKPCTTPSPTAGRAIGYAQALAQLERSFLKFQAELPVNYVRREDWVRGQSVIEAKLDSLALRMENIQLKGVRHES